MGVSMDPAALGQGAARFAGKGEELSGHATTVGELVALRAAFAGAGEQLWPGVEARLTELIDQLKADQERVAHTGTLLATAAGEFSTMDQGNAGAVNAVNGGR